MKTPLEKCSHLSRLWTRRSCRVPPCSSKSASTTLKAKRVDLVKDPWPFGRHGIGGIVNVHSFLPALIPWFEPSLLPGGYLLLETAAGCGGNYLELPMAGYVRRALEKA